MATGMLVRECTPKTDLILPIFYQQQISDNTRRVPPKKTSLCNIHLSNEFAPVDTDIGILMYWASASLSFF